MPTQDPVKISEEDATGLDALANQITALSCHLGALRAEYMIAEARLMSDLNQSYEIRDALLTQIARRYVEGKAGRWTYSAEQRALIQEE
jgi:hypothetical protein